MYVCMCVCVRFLTFSNPTQKWLEISIWNLMHQWSSHNPLVVTIFMIIDARFVILWNFNFFFKCAWYNSKFLTLSSLALSWALWCCLFCTHVILLDVEPRLKTTHKYIILIKELWYWIWPKSIKAFKFFQILNFLRIFEKLARKSQANFDLSNSNLVRKCTNIVWCLILRFVRIVRKLKSRRMLL